MIEVLLGGIFTAVVTFGSFIGWQAWLMNGSIRHIEGKLDLHDYRITQLEKDSE